MTVKAVEADKQISADEVFNGEGFFARETPNSQLALNRIRRLMHSWSPAAEKSITIKENEVPANFFCQELFSSWKN